METMPFIEDRNSVFARLEETAARANLSKEEREIYEEQWKNYNDYYNTIDYAVEQGEKKGRAEGRDERNIEIARTMKVQGCSTQLIVACTGLSEEEIERL